MGSLDAVTILLDRRPQKPVNQEHPSPRCQSLFCGFNCFQKQFVVVVVLSKKENMTLSPDADLIILLALAQSSNRTSAADIPFQLSVTWSAAVRCL